MTDADHAGQPNRPEDDAARSLRLFVMQLGAALNAAGHPAYAVQEQLARVAQAYGAHGARISAFPTYLIVSMDPSESAALELTSVTAQPRLDQIAALDRLIHQAMHGEIAPREGIRQLSEIHRMAPRYGPVQRVAGYAVLTLGLCLILQPAPRDIAAAVALGSLVGILQVVGQHHRSLGLLMPLVAASSVSAISALAVKHGLTGPGLRAMVASLVVFLPGAALTTAVLELTAGQMISGSSRLVAGAMQLALLAFGIIAGVEAVGVPSTAVFADSPELLGAWAPWLGVLVFAVGVSVANSAPQRSLPGLLLVLYAAWTGQVVANELVGGYVSAFVGGLVMTPVAVVATRLPSSMPQHASFLPAFWLLVPGALGLIGLMQVAADAGAAGRQDLIDTTVTIFAVAIGVLTGTLLLGWASATSRMAAGMSSFIAERSPWLSRFRRNDGHESPQRGDDGPCA